MKKHSLPLRFLLLLALAAVGVTMLAPFVWQVGTSLKPLSELDNGSFWPRHWRPDNYRQVLDQIPYVRYYLNSLVVAASVTLLQVLTSATAGYAFSRLHWRGRDKVFLAYLATMMVPGVVTLIPNFALMWKLHLYDTYAGLILPSAFGAFGTFLIRQFMLGIPASLNESARIDGATEWQTFWEIIFPLARPALATLAIFTFMGNYSSFLWPLIMVKGEGLRTLPLGLMFFDSSHGVQTNLLMAASAMAIVPLVIVFLLFQRQIIAGLQSGAVKG
ncbi:carbohydrate ABC transporter membrane protein 2, CUT1 family [Verrucomicrobium sp. GAS474]|uniref:carbohydrate ABC transporter permease n=1 Tax=Verrucomicrobium sp. GAS474 TaxID=1882831 RepID=UPI00087D8203|nr:carbohydrate ABC transporter permease [Verrucomicrobium sp. GAS474]SDT94066.1 carbohydrate ABC transporter membrane protein 2, CUT1 family [Verrucomicrobium sp. GAS474]